MGFIKKIWGYIKSGFNKIREFFKDKNPTQIIEDATKAVVGVATIAGVCYVGINAVRAMLMRSKSGKHRSGQQTGADLMLEDREVGSTDEKIARARRSFQDTNNRYVGMTQEDADMLNEIAKNRNTTFQAMTPAQQFNLLKLEGFDFEAFKKSHTKTRGKIRRSSRRVGEASPENQAFREPVDYGKLNWLMRPLDDVICWLKNDPTPKPVPQVHVIDRNVIPNFRVTSTDSMVATLRNLGDYLDSGKTDRITPQLETIADAKERAICAEELFRHKSFKEYQRAVKNRMDAERGLSSQIFDLMEEDMRSEKKKKKHYEDDDDDHESMFYGKKHKKSKDDSEKSSKNDRYAKRVYEHFLNQIISGKETHRGYHFDHLFDEDDD